MDCVLKGISFVFFVSFVVKSKLSHDRAVSRLDIPRVFSKFWRTIFLMTTRTANNMAESKRTARRGCIHEN